MATDGAARHARGLRRVIRSRALMRLSRAAAVFVAPALALAAPACTRRHPIDGYPRNVVDPAPALASQIEAVRRDCEARGRRVSYGVCERADRAWVFFSRRSVTTSQEVAYDADTGARVFVEERSWSDVCPASFLPDAVRVFGDEPPCTPAFNDACGALDGLEEWLSRR